jgi:zinc/manganese transport system ATP-binding protein
MADTCIEFSHLTLGYRGHLAVHHLDGVLRCGSLTALVGPNGSGKSTLIKGIVGMLKPLAGTCTVKHGIRLAYLPQQSELDRSFPARVVDLVSLGLWPRRGLLRRYRPEDRQAVEEALRVVGLEGFAQRSIDTLSGGQLQRALFARVLVQDADLILLDEPFNAIDTKTVADLIGLIKRWHGEQRTVLAVLHDLDLAREHFPEALLLARRLIARGDTQAVLTPDSLRRARQFQEDWDERTPQGAPGSNGRSSAGPDADERPAHLLVCAPLHYFDFERKGASG